MASLKGDGASFFQILVGTLITLAFIGLIATTVLGSTQLVTQTNYSLTVPADGLATDIPGREVVSTSLIYNGSDDLSLHNISLRTATSSTTGLITVQIYNNATSTSAGDLANATYTHRPDGYLN